MPNDYLTDIFHLKNRVIVLTGGMGKLGAEYAEALAKAGGRVAIFDVVDVPNKKLSALAADYPLRFLKVDITRENEVAEAVALIEREWDTPTVLINNAGWKASPNEPSKASVPFEEYPIEVWEEVFRINTTAAAICAKVVGKAMIARQKGGVIINVASHYALVSPDQRIYDYRKNVGKGVFVKDASYSASKAALIALTRDLATQWARYGIRVVALAPGGVSNPRSDKEFVEAYSRHVPLGRMANIDEYNGVIIFLASDASSYITGATLIIDGGWTAW